jgi:hypothetical protein
MTISPKAIAATLIPLVAAALLLLITGDDTYLVGCLLALVGGGAAVLAPPATGVKQSDVDQLAHRRQHGL